MKLRQQLLTHLVAKQKPKSLTLGWSEEAGVELGLNNRCNSKMKKKAYFLLNRSFYYYQRLIKLLL